MLISELSAALDKVRQIVGDVPVVLKEIVSAAETEVKSLGVSITPGTEANSGTVTLEHTATTAAAAEPATEPPAA